MSSTRLKSRRSGRYVLYWMQQSQRARFNPALELAIDEANARDLPVLVCFGLMDRYPEANARHYAFMLEGLAEVERDLSERGMAFVIRRGAPDAGRASVLPARLRSSFATGAISSRRRRGGQA